MSKRSRFIARVEKRWIAFFGEPPAIRADPVLMLKILEDCEGNASAAVATRAA
jgi:hypothetical protein